MHHRYLTAVFGAGLVALGGMSAGAQSASTPAEGSSYRTSWGDPDLQGAWTNTTTTPLQRPVELGEKVVYSAEERAELAEEQARHAENACATELVVLRRAPPPQS